MNILLIDNHDSFTFNLVELLRHNGKVNFNVVRSDDLHPEQVHPFDKIIFSPGPGLPDEQPCMYEMLRHFEGKKPILGICLGLQAIALYYGAKLFNLNKVVHGQPRQIEIIRPVHYLFSGLKPDFTAGLYHSWAVDESTVPGSLRVICRSAEGLVMGLAHHEADVCGLQFHPESVITGPGQKMMDNWIMH